MRWLFFINAVFFSGILGAQQYLVGNSDGKWMIYHEKERIELPSTVHYLGNFDEAGLAIFAEFDRYGVLDQHGKIRCAATFQEIKSLGNGYFTALNDHGASLIDVKDDILANESLGQCEILTNFWYEISNENEKTWLNTSSSRKYTLQEGDSLLKAGFGFLYVNTPSGTILLDPGGDTISLEFTTPTFTQNHVTICAPQYKAIVFRNRVIQLSLNAENIGFLENDLMYTLEGQVFVLDGESGELKLTVSSNKLVAFDREFYLCQKGANWGLIRKNGDVFIPSNYLAVYRSGPYFQVVNREGSGLLDSLGSEVLQCRYRRIAIQGEFFKLTSTIDLEGLVSKKNPSLNLPCQYNEIRVGSNSIKGYTDNYLRIIHFDREHKIQDNVLLENVIDVQMRGKMDKGERIDSRLFDLGWFCKNVGQFDEEGYLIGERLKWGLLGFEDTLLLPARYRQPLFIPQADFSMINRGKKEQAFYGNEEEVELWTMMSHISGRPVSQEMILSIDTVDLLFRNYVRLFTQKGPAVFLPGNKMMSVDYIDPGMAEIQRYCISSSHTVKMAKQTDKESVGLPTWNQNDNPNFSITIKEFNKTSNFVKFPDARWNFLTQEGEPLFEEDFDYVFPFFCGRSIVKQNGRWGLVSRDTTLIQPIFSAVDRVSELGDTVFLVKRTPQGIQLYDSAFHALDPGITRLLGSSSDLSLVECGREKKILNQDHRYVSDSSSYQKIISGHYILSKSRKEYILRDAKGNLLGSFELKPEMVIFDKYLLVQSHGKCGLIDFFGDTVLDFRFHEIRQNGSFIVAVDKWKNPVYSKDLKLLCEAKDARVLIDPVQDRMALVKKGKCRIYSINGPVKGKVNGLDAQLFYNGWFLTVGVGAKAISSAGKQITFPEIIRNVEGLDKFGFLVEDLKGRCYFYDANFSLLSDSLNLRQAKYHGSGCISANCNKQTLLMTPSIRKWLPAGTRVEGQFEHARLLLRLGESHYYFLDEMLENPFQRVFTTAHPFSGDFASVEEGDGWTIIDHEGNRKSLGSYEELTPLDNGIFMTSRQPLYGLYDNHGKIILPVEFQEIHVIDSNLIQAVRNGQIEYYDLKGKELTSSLLTHELTWR